MKMIKGLYIYEVTYKHSDYSNQLHLHVVANYLEVKVNGQADDPTTACSVFKSATIDFAQYMYISQKFPNIQYQLCVNVCPSKPHFIPFHALEEEVGVNCKVMVCHHCKEDVDLGDNTLVWLRAT